MSNTIRVGLIGAGKMGLLHGGIFNTLDESELVCIAEKDKLIHKGLNKYANNIEVYSDYEKMFEENCIDLVAITTPVFLHKEMILKALDHNLDIFVEKPLSKNWEQSKKLLKASNKSRTMVGYCRRFMGTYELAKRIIKNNLLGETHYIQSQLFVSDRLKEGNGWRFDPQKSGGGVLRDLGCHAIDLFHFLFGQIDKVHGLASHVFNDKVEDYVTANLSFKNQLKGSLQVSWSTRNYRLPELKVKIYLENGEIIVTEKYINIYSDIDNEFISEGWNTWYKQELTDDVKVNLAGPEYTKEDSHLLQCIRENKETRSNFKEAAKTDLVLDKIYSSIHSSKTKKIRGVK